MKRVRVALLIAVAIIGVGLYWSTAPPAQRGSMQQFEPTRLANLETRMWQAYYEKQNVRLFGLLVVMLREQYHYSWAVSVREAFHLARAAATFGNARSNYEQVLPSRTCRHPDRG